MYPLISNNPSLECTIRRMLWGGCMLACCRDSRLGVFHYFFGALRTITERPLILQYSPRTLTTHPLLCLWFTVDAWRACCVHGMATGEMCRGLPPCQSMKTKEGKGPKSTSFEPPPPGSRPPVDNLVMLEVFLRVWAPTPNNRNIIRTLLRSGC